MRSKLLLGVGLFLLVLRCQEDETGDKGSNAGASGTAGAGVTGGGGSGGSGGMSGDSATGGDSGETGTGGVAGSRATGGSSGSSSGNGGSAGDGGEPGGGAGGEGGGGDGPSPVTGQIVGLNLGGLPGVVVTIGDHSVVTDANGMFTFDDVPSTYDLIAITEAEHYVRVVRELTTRAPVFWSYGTVPERTANVQGNVTGPTFPLPTKNYLFVAYTGPSYASSPSVFANSSNGNYVVVPRWVGPNAVNGKIISLFQEDSSQDHPVAFHGFVSKPFTVSAGGTYSPSAETTVALQNVGNHAVSGDVTVPADYDPVVWANVGPFWTDTIDPTTSGPYTTNLPTGIPELTQYIQLHAEHELATGVVEMSEAHFLVTDSSSTLALMAPAAPRAVLPIDAAVGIDLDTNFSWTKPADSIGTLAFRYKDAQGNDWILDITGTGTSTHLPDLTSFGIALTPGEDCVWGVGVVLNATTTDDFAAHEVDPIGYLVDHLHSGLGFAPARTCTIAD